MAYPAFDRPPMLAHRQSFHGPAQIGYSPYDDMRPGYDEDGPYPYGEPMRGMYDEPMTGALGLYGDTYAQPGYPTYAPPMQYGAGGSYDDLGYEDPSYSLAPYAAAGYATPHRRRSFSYGAMNHYGGGYGRMGSGMVKFRHRGSLRSGISLVDAMSHTRLSNNEAYKWHDLNPDSRGRILLKIRWPGYTSLTYEIPLDSYDGRLNLATLARRVARACVHFIQVNAIPISWDRVRLYHLEEISVGTWAPILTAR